MDIHTSDQPRAVSKKRCPLRKSQLRRLLSGKNTIDIFQLHYNNQAKSLVDLSRARSSRDMEDKSFNSSHSTPSKQEDDVRDRASHSIHLSARSDRSIKGTTWCQRTTNFGSDQYHSPCYTRGASTAVSVQSFEAVAAGIGEQMNASDGSLANLFRLTTPLPGCPRASILQWQQEMERTPYPHGLLNGFRRHTH